jgi:hypothetical protein
MIFIKSFIFDAILLLISYRTQASLLYPTVSHLMRLDEAMMSPRQWTIFCRGLKNNPIGPELGRRYYSLLLLD